MKLSSYLNPNYIFTNVEAKTVEEAITQMVGKMSHHNEHIKENEKNVIDAVLKREAEISTAIGSDIMLPHARLSDFGDFIISIAVLKNPLDVMMPLTNTPTTAKVIFLILADVLSNKNILKAMSAISKLCIKKPELLEKIKNAKDKHEIIRIFEEAAVEIVHNVTADDIFMSNIKPVEPDTTLEVVAKRLIVEQTNGLPVVDKDGKFLGEITERELIAFGMPDYAKSGIKNLNFVTVGEPFQEYLLKEGVTTIKDIYRKDGLYIIDSKTPIMEICFIMVKDGATRLYVVEKGKYLGTVKRSDIIKKILHL